MNVLVEVTVVLQIHIVSIQLDLILVNAMLDILKMGVRAKVSIFGYIVNFYIYFFI